jgi:alkylhydroperoxidase/carboxymuconolactone decarboxylase family protein YurZ
MQNSHDRFHQGRQTAGIIDARAARLIALGASMAANDESTFAESIEALKADGTPEDEIRLAVQVGQTVKDKPAGIMKRLADDQTGTGLWTEAPAVRCPAEAMRQTPIYALTMLIAAGSAMAANCEPCLNKVIPDLIEAGVPDNDIRRALEIGQSVKDQKANEMKEAADILGGTSLSGRSVAGRLASVGCLPWSACNCA